MAVHTPATPVARDPHRPPSPSRRRVLQGGLVLGGGVLVAGCGLFEDGGPLGGSDEPGPDVVALRAALADEVGLLAAYDATLAAHPALAPALQPLRAEHAEHRRVVLDRLGDDAEAEPEAAGSPPGAAPGPPPVPVAPADPAAAVAELSRREDDAARDRRRSTLSVSSPLAPLLGSVAASEASHPLVLAGAVR